MRSNFVSRLNIAAATRAFIAVMACVLAFALNTLHPVSIARLDESLRDSYQQLTASNIPEQRLTIVDIDEQTLRDVGKWPWPRSRVADLLETLLAGYGARAIGVDMVFPEAADPAGDERLEALALHAPLTLAQIFDYQPRSPALAIGYLGGVDQSAAAVSAHAFGFIANQPALAQARCLGNIGYVPDSDGVLRRIPLATEFEGRAYHHFTLALMQCAGLLNPAAAISPRIDHAGFWRIAKWRSLDAYTVIPASAILDQTAPRELLEGRLVLIGSSALSLGDRVSIPIASLAAGVMVHAEALSALLDQAQAPLPSQSLVSILWLNAWVVGGIGIFMLLVGRVGAWGSVVCLAGLTAGWVLLALWAVKSQLEFSLTAPLASYLFLLCTSIPFEWWQAQRRNRRLIDTLGHYVAPSVLDEILRQGLPNGLNPVLREVTVLIADMEGYTANTTALSLDAVAELTKSFLDALTRPVLAHGGTLDKYTGDGLVAFWGAPLLCADQADRAARVALEILAAVASLNIERQQRGFSPVRVRIGIESGVALVGDLGTSFRSTYTAVGDCINHASRLESAARDFPVPLIIGGAAAAKLKQHSVTALGTITLRGTQSAIDVFTLAELMPSEAARPLPA